MSQGVAEALAFLKALGTPADLAAPSCTTCTSTVRQKVNSHIHLPPNFSAFQTVGQALELAAAQGIGVLGVSNYYDYEVYGDFAAGARKAGIFPLFGLEIICLIDDLVKAGVKINDPGNPGKMYVCGKGITRFAPFNPEAQRLLGIIRQNDSTRMREVIVRLGEVLAQRGLPIKPSEADVIDMVAKRHQCPRERIYLQERHVCQAFQEAIFSTVPAAQRMEKLTRAFGLTAAPKFGPEEAVKIQNEIRAQLMKAGKPAYVAETFVNFDQAYRLILELGGIPAYPTLADGTSPACPFEDPVEKLISNIKNLGFTCAEFIPIRNTPEVLSHYVKAMRAAGLIVTAGTEHNTLDLLPIEPACVKNIPVPDDVKEIFWEGTCVVAAHQFLTLHGECGFVDSQGRPNPKYADASDRIAAFKTLGAAVIQRYTNSKR
jgi:predicted metal-dependent phosphoesterase TrpH